jgi:hypothetical protein
MKEQLMKEQSLRILTSCLMWLARAGLRLMTSQSQGSSISCKIVALRKIFTDRQQFEIRVISVERQTFQQFEFQNCLHIFMHNKYTVLSSI